MSSALLHISDSKVGQQAEDDLGGIDVAVQQAVDRDVDAVVHTGNLFHHSDPEGSAVTAVADALSDLEPAEVPFFAIEGGREVYGDANALNRLQDHYPVRKLSTDPSTVGDIALYGIDHADDEETLVDRLRTLPATDGFTYNVICVNQRVWPPLWKEAADVSAYDLMEATDVHINAVLAGGFNETRAWESDEFDDYRVVYPGSSNPAEREAGDSANGWLIEADTESSRYEEVPLVTSTTGAHEELAQLWRTIELEQSDIDDANLERLADLYGLAARAGDVLDQRSREIRDEITDRVEDPGRHIEGRYARVYCGTKKNRSPKSEDVVLERVDAAGIDPEEVLTVDPPTLRNLADDGEIDEDDVLEIDYNTYCRVQEVWKNGRSDD